MQYFYDTYAMVEIALGNPAYNDYLKAGVVTTAFQLYEMYYALLRLFGKEKAEKYFERYIDYSQDFGYNVLKKASEFKLKHKTKKLSYADCQGYMIALELGIPFLTSDKEFKGLPNVEYVK